MKTRYAVTMAMIAGIGIGAMAVQGLQAQTKAVYLVTEIDVSNQDAYMKEYSPLAQASIKKAGGKIVAAGLNNIVAVEGPAPKRVVIQQWDSMEAATAWRTGADYKAARVIGDKYAKFHSYAVPAAAP